MRCSEPGVSVAVGIHASHGQGRRAWVVNSLGVMALNIYEVIFWEADGKPDAIYIITAHSHIEAAEMAERDRRLRLEKGEPGLSGDSGAVCLLGESRIASPEPQIIRGPFLETGYTRGETMLYDPACKKWFTNEDYYKPRHES